MPGAGAQPRCLFPFFHRRSEKSAVVRLALRSKLPGMAPRIIKIVRRRGKRGGGEEGEEWIATHVSLHLYLAIVSSCFARAPQKRCVCVGKKRSEGEVIACPPPPSSAVSREKEPPPVYLKRPTPPPLPPSLKGEGGALFKKRCH